MSRSTSGQWSIDEFQKRDPVYRVNAIQVGLLAAALSPFGFGLCYMVGGQYRALLDGSYGLLMLTSLLGGGLLVAAACVIAVEWIKALHYANLRKSENALSKCQDLLRAALQDGDLVAEWARRENERPSFIRRLKKTVVSASEGSLVEMYDDELVFALIDQWITRGGRPVAQVVSTQLSSTRGSANAG